MSDGTIRGTFDLNADPAVRGMRSIRTAGAEADVVVRQLGSSLDSIGGPNTQRKLDATSGNVRDIATAAEEARVGVEELGGALDEVGRKNASAHVEVNGVAAALADVKALEAALDRLDRRNAQARIGVGGGFGGVPAQAARAAAGGSGGSQGGLLSALAKRGPFGVPLGLLGLGLGAVAPLGGAAIGIGGSAAAAATGAGVVGGAGLATLGVGLAPSVFGIKQFANSVKQAETAQKAYNLAVAQYGAASKQAATAKQRMDAVFGQNPGTRRAISELQQLRTAAHNSITVPVRQQVTRAAGNILHDVRTRALPQLAPGIRVDAAATATGATAFSSFLTQPGGAPMTAAIAMQREFARDVPIMEHSLENITTLFSNVARAALPYFHEANLWVQNTTQGWASWSQNTTKVNSALDHGVTSFREWRDLATATFHLVRDLFSAGRPSGDSLVGSLTTQLNTWDIWIKTNPQRVRQFFSDAERDTKRIAGAVWQIAKALGEVSSLLAPILGNVAKLVSTFGAAGLLIPSALRFGAGRLLGGGVGARGGGGLLVGGPGAGTVGAVGGAAGGGAGGLPMLVAPGAYLAPRGLGAQRLAPIATPEAFAQAYGLVPGARYGGPVSTAGSRAYGLSRLRAPLGRIGGAALRFAVPTMAISGTIGALTTPGTFAERAQGFASSATFGLISPPLTQAAGRDLGAQRGLTHLQNFTQVSDPHTAQLRLGAEQRSIARLTGMPVSAFRTTPGLLGQLASSANQLNRTGGSAARQSEVRTIARDAQRTITQLNQMWDAAARQHAQTYSTHFGQAFNVYSKRMGPEKAMRIMRGDILDEMKGMRPAGQKVLAQNALGWMNQMQKDNPALKGQYEELKKAITAQFDAMGKHIQIVNGQILDGSKTEWGNISFAMSDPLEKAKERMSKSFTQIQLMAIGSLTALGYSPAQARSLVRGMEKGGLQATPASQLRQRTGSGQLSLQSQMNRNAQGANVSVPKRQGGGRLPGAGLADTVKMSDGGYGAPGELVLNRHLERDVDRDLWRAGKLTLDQRVRGSTRLHSAPFGQEGAFAKGGRLAGVGAGLGSVIGTAGVSARGAVGRGTGGLHAAISSIVTAVLGHFPGLSITSTTGGGHAAGSYHYRGEAADLAGSSGLMYNAAQWVKASGIASSLAEGIHNPNLSVKYGRSVAPGFWGSGTWAQHANHIHLAATGGAMTGLGAGGAIGGAAQAIALHGIRSGLRGYPGALADRGSDIYAKGLQDKINQHLGAAGGGGGLGGFTGGGTARQNQMLGHKMMLAAGWGEAQWPALRALWEGESNWLPKTNPSSGAYGIPQALGHGHPYDIGDIPGQIRWGLNYIRQTYGSPASAYHSWLSRSPHWYAKGGRLGAEEGAGMIGRPSWLGWFNRGTDFTTTPGRPVMFGAGEKRRERVRIEPLSRKGSASSGGHVFNFDFSGATITSEEHAKAIGEQVVTKVIEALDRGQVPDSAVA